MNCFNHSCQGESHKAFNKECQDYSLTWQNEDKNITIAVVCDGHGSDSYFRSAVGARLAAEITKEQLLQFIIDVDSSTTLQELFVGQRFTAIGIQKTVELENKLNSVMRRLFESIYSLWREAITKDGQRELTDWEKEHVETKYISLLDDNEHVVKVYGCTLMAYVCTSKYWFAFHIGDGKMIMLDSKFEFSQPVPWDEKCFLNKTTSLCESEPIKDFRFCVEGDGKFPVAVFLGSDGLDDSYGDGPKLNSFYGGIVKELALKGQMAVEEMLKEDLPKISKIGSQDDMSVAVVYDEHKIAEAAISINEYQKNLLMTQISELQQRIKEKKSFVDKTHELEASVPTRSKLDGMFNKIQELERLILSSRKEYESAKKIFETTDIEKMKVEARMAEKEIAREMLHLERLRERLNQLELFTL